MTRLKAFLTSPFFLMALAILVGLAAFRVPEFADYLLGGAIIVIAQSFVGIATLLLAVWIARFTRAAFSKGATHEITLPYAVLVGFVYLSCACVVSAVILS